LLLIKGDVSNLEGTPSEAGVDPIIAHGFGVVEVGPRKSTRT
jgi:hypothetical protein